MPNNIFIKKDKVRVLERELEEILEFFPKDLKLQIAFELKKFNNNVQEIRLRKNKPVCVFSNGKNYCLKAVSSENAFDYIFNRLCKYSVYSYQQDINNGFITTDFGARVGICGTAVLDNEKMVSVKDISTLNFRIAKDFCKIAKKILTDNLESIIIAGPPTSGKTTLLRDIARFYSNIHYKVCVVDERNEISANCFDLGNMTDCLKGYKKAFGVQIALRTLSPQVVIFDEIGTLDECEAVIECMNAGINVVTSVHCKNSEEFFKRKVCKKLIDTDFFEKIVFLNKNAGIIDEIYYLKG